MRDTAIRNIYPVVVTINGDADARDKDGNSIVLDENKIDTEIKRLKWENAVVSKIQEIEIAYNNDNQLDIAYMNTIFQADNYSQDLITKVLVTGSVPDGFYWLDKANNKVSMIYAQLQGLGGTILARGQANFDKRLQLKTQVKQATTQAELDAIKW